MTDNSPYIYNKRRPHFKEKSKHVAYNIPTHAREYIKSLFPLAGWIGRYNLTWLYGDIVAGLTAGAVVIPQGMAYSKVAGLPPEYGLYSSFVGVSIYFLFATSKDITIGPTAVMSLLLGQVMATKTKYDVIDMASSYALFAGIFSLVMGLFRLGFLLDFIPGPVIAGFTTGSAITISIGQVYKLMGITTTPKIESKDPTYLILGRTLAALPTTKLDAAFGLIGLLYLYGIKYGTRYATKRWPQHKRLFFFIEILRNITAVIFASIIAYVINIGKNTSPISILKTIPSGLHIGHPIATLDMIKELGGLVSVTFILILEHVAIAKSFGRINDYKINPSQELIAIGVTNAIGSVFHAYPATGSFSRTAIKSKSGVRTPLAGVFSGILVIIALYLTAVFYYIPDAILSAIIIHAVLDLIASPTYVKQLWRIQFWDLIVFVVGVLVTFFLTVEYGIYASALLALVVLLVRLARPRFDTLGRLALKTRNGTQRYAYVPIDHPSFDTVEHPPEGVLIFRFNESLTYPNASYLDDQIVEYARTNTKRYYKQADKKGDRPWNEIPDQKKEDEEKSKAKPRLHAVIFDFAAVSVIDSTGIQALGDIRKELNKFASQNVEFHFANIIDEDIEESLIIGGFGTVDGDYNITANGQTDVEATSGISKGDEESTINEINNIDDDSHNTKRFFHLTIDEAVAAATNARS